MDLITAFILGVVQGVSEWLPVSSSGHLVLFRELFGLEGSVSYDIFLHCSALWVILVFFWPDIRKVAAALFRWRRDTYEFKVAGYIAGATLVTGLFGFLLRPHIAGLGSLRVVPFTFLLTSLLLFLSKRTGTQRITFQTALFMGLLQGLALLPGVSRSGATISAAKISGADNREAFRFSFLMALPAIAGAVVIERQAFALMPPPVLLVGFVTSLCFGLGSLYFLRRLMVQGKFYRFGYYTLALSITLFIHRAFSGG